MSSSSRCQVPIESLNYSACFFSPERHFHLTVRQIRKRPSPYHISFFNHAPTMAGRSEQCKNMVREMEIVLDNYTIILEKAVMLDPDCGTAYAKQILYTIFKMYMPLIEAEMKNCRRFLHAVALKNLETKVEDLKTKDGNRDAGQWTEQDFISPIVLLLKLGNDRGDISFDQERTTGVGFGPSLNTLHPSTSKSIERRKKSTGLVYLVVSFRLFRSGHPIKL